MRIFLGEEKYTENVYCLLVSYLYFHLLHLYPFDLGGIISYIQLVQLCIAFARLHLQNNGNADLNE